MLTRETTVPFVDLERQHRVVADDLRAAFERVIARGSFTLGEEVQAFEAEFAAVVGTTDAIGVASGTDALHFALKACGVGPGDEVITAVNTFAATAEAVLMCGARPVFVDIDPRTYLMDLEQAARAVTARTKAVVPVHLYGQCVDMRRVRELADRCGLKVVEDACQAHGASFDGLSAGAASDAGCFSFYPSKNLGALGDGGIITTSDPAVAARARSLRNHGEDATRLHVESGYCSRLHGLQAALLRAKLPCLADWNEQRRAAAESYRRALEGVDVVLPVENAGGRHVYHLFVVQVADRERVRDRLAERGVQSAVHYAVPLHLEPAFGASGYHPGDFPVAEAAADRILSLPMFPYLSDDDVRHVASALREALDV